ncbi:DUF488 domain-containing protein [Pararhizobium sp. BT-229]|uniref:DUF488 domain-containing protein n=1 Tax=Pararhizobium sp. BT-229 TaxID=2986923 RepID=UPI0021F77BF1|nr:DUF488 domain-containing protein [Pararhizobium sp. BT-229]MCV9960678.1 DUF488 domain-containing protein [Pararhizobium sp. BT-229]
MQIDIATIGFTQSSAANFFGRLRQAGVKKVVDIRLHNTSQLAGFAKAADLPYFLKELCGADYVHQPLLAPTEDILTAFKKEKGDWNSMRDKFMGLMAERRIETRLEPALFAGSCLLCSEALPHHCHRQLVCEYLDGKWGGTLSVRHL